MPDGAARSYIALACILCFLLFMQMLISPVYWLLMAELFPMRLRGVLTGGAVACLPETKGKSLEGLEGYLEQALMPARGPQG